MVSTRAFIISILVIVAAVVLYLGGYMTGKRGKDLSQREANLIALVNDSLKQESDSLKKTVQVLHSRLETQRTIVAQDSTKLDSLAKRVQVQSGKVIIDKKPYVVPVTLTDYIQDQAQQINSLRIEVATLQQRTAVQDTLLTVEQERIDSLTVAYQIAKKRESNLPFVGGLLLGGLVVAGLHFFLK